MVAARAPGDRPTDAGDARIVPRRVTLTLSPQAYALLETARTEATRGAGSTVDDSAFVTEVALAYLNGGGDRDAGRAAFQIALTVDPHGGAVMHAGGEAIAVDEVLVEMARCDAQHVGVVDGDGSATRATQDIPPRTRREVELRHGRRCAVPGCTHGAFVHIHHVTPRSEGGTHDPDELVLLCSRHHDAAHRGALVVRGTFREGFDFAHADGRPYARHPAGVEARGLVAGGGCPRCGGALRALRVTAPPPLASDPSRCTAPSSACAKGSAAPSAILDRGYRPECG